LGGNSKKRKATVERGVLLVLVRRWFAKMLNSPRKGADQAEKKVARGGEKKMSLGEYTRKPVNYYKERKRKKVFAVSKESV